MTCKSVQDNLSAYLDRELASGEMAAIRAHLHDCDACADEARALRTLKSMLNAAPTPEPPSDFAERLTAAVLADRAPITRKPLFRVPAFTFAGVAACSMAITFVVLSALRPTESNPTPSARLDNQIPFQVQRDQIYGFGSDATSGAPVISAAAYGPR